MTTPEEPTPPTQTDKRDRRLRMAFGFAALAAVVLVALFFTGYFMGWVYFPRYTSPQWAAAGSWFGAIGSLSAVTVALWQTKLARRDAAQDKVESAEKTALLKQQFESELKAADDRLARQLGESRRTEQIKALAGIWPAIDDLTPAFNSLREASNAASAGTGSELEQEYKRGQVKDAARELRRILNRVELVFEPALIRTIEPTTQQELTNLYQRYRTWYEFASNITRSAERGISPNFGDAADYLNDIRNCRRSFINTVRVNLTGAPPLDDNDD